MNRERNREAGYNLVMLMVAVTVLNILVAISLPAWSQAIRREKEEELIFRGLQYAEAIRVFQMRYQRFPSRLDELIEVKPRCIRQLWKDPMTENGKWGLIFQGQQTPLTPQTPGEDDGEQGQGDPDGRRGGRKPVKPDDDTGGPIDGGDDDESAFGGPRKGEEVAVGPIIGVYSKSGKASIMTFFGRERYDEWRFTVDLFSQGGGPPPNPGAMAPRGQGIQLSTRWLGRPLPSFLSAPGMDPRGPQGGTMPDGTSGGLDGRKPQPGNKPQKPR
jgi:type II secretory pathway pseudopilin PulG